MVAHQITAHVKTEAGLGVADCVRETEDWLRDRKDKFPKKKARTDGTLLVSEGLGEVNTPSHPPSRLERAIRAGMRQAQLIKRQLREKMGGKNSVCAHWQAYGKCRYGDECRHAHLKQGICGFFSSHGRCRHGNSCKYEHVSKRELDKRRAKDGLPSGVGGGHSTELGFSAVSSGALLKRLLLGEVTQFNNTVLQVMRYICQENWFGVVEGAKVEEAAMVESDFDDFSDDESD